MNDQALTKIEPMPQDMAMESRHAGPLDMEPIAFRAGLDRRKENRNALMEWIRSALVENVDYGRIPTKRGPSKPSLFKPGAEKICGMLGIITTFPTLTEYEQAAFKGVEVKSVVLRCALLDSRGVIVAEGVGARSLAQDYGDLNKALKMAEKSAHIDATLRMAGLSEVFTQDIEDMPPRANVEPERKPASVPRGKPEKPKPAERMEQFPVATEEQRLRWIAELKLRGEWALGYCYDKAWLLPESGPPDDITPGEPLEMLEARHVPTTRKAADVILAELDSLIPADQRPKPASASRPPSTSGGQASGASQGNVAPKNTSLRHSEPDQQPWYSAVVPVPYKGMKRDQYLKKPDTIGELYNLRHDDDQARRRLFGFVHNFESKGWTNREGKQMPPSKADIQFRNDLDAFADWFQENHPDESND